MQTGLQDCQDPLEPLREALQQLRRRAPNGYRVTYESPAQAQHPHDAELIWKTIGQMPSPQRPPAAPSSAAAAASSHRMTHSQLPAPQAAAGAASASRPTHAGTETALQSDDHRNHAMAPGNAQRGRAHADPLVQALGISIMLQSMQSFGSHQHAAMATPQPAVVRSDHARPRASLLQPVSPTPQPSTVPEAAAASAEAAFLPGEAGVRPVAERADLPAEACMMLAQEPPCSPAEQDESPAAVTAAAAASAGISIWPTEACNGHPQHIPSGPTELGELPAAGASLWPAEACIEPPQEPASMPTELVDSPAMAAAAGGPVVDDVGSFPGFVLPASSEPATGAFGSLVETVDNTDWLRMRSPARSRAANAEMHDQPAAVHSGGPGAAQPVSLANPVPNVLQAVAMDVDPPNGACIPSLQQPAAPAQGGYGSNEATSDSHAAPNLQAAAHQAAASMQGEFSNSEARPAGPGAPRIQPAVHASSQQGLTVPDPPGQASILTTDVSVSHGARPPPSTNPVPAQQDDGIVDLTADSDHDAEETLSSRRHAASAAASGSLDRARSGSKSRHDRAAPSGHRKDIRKNAPRGSLATGRRRPDAKHGNELGYCLRPALTLLRETAAALTCHMKNEVCFLLVHPDLTGRSDLHLLLLSQVWMDDHSAGCLQLRCSISQHCTLYLQQGRVVRF